MLTLKRLAIDLNSGRALEVIERFIGSQGRAGPPPVSSSPPVWLLPIRGTRSGQSPCPAMSNND